MSSYSGCAGGVPALAVSDLLLSSSRSSVELSLPSVEVADGFCVTRNNFTVQ